MATVAIRPRSAVGGQHWLAAVRESETRKQTKDSAAGWEEQTAEQSAAKLRIHCVGGCHDWADAEWIVIRGALGFIMIRPSGGQPPAGLFVFLVTIY
jgi:hypothetical protein